MTFGVEAEEAEAHRQLDRFLEAGGTLVDTANTYGAGRSEEIIGRWFAGRPAEVTERVVLATKGRFPLDDAPNGSGLSARHLTRALDASLRRLGLDAVDLYQVHAFDPWTPLEETLRTLDGVRASGPGPLLRAVQLHRLAADQGGAPGPGDEHSRAGDPAAAVQPAGT
jgi:aryl-alcohol dehydrogenase (NADP+)